VAGVALGDIDRHFAWQAWHLWHWTGSGAALVSHAVAPAVGVAGVILGDIDLHFAWQAWHLVTWTVTLRGRDWLWWHAWVSAWQAWVTSSFALRGRCGTW